MPLALTWFMMSVEGPLLAAVIARLADAKFNLAAYGVAFSLALIIEAPVIMIMSASTALVKDSQSYYKLRSFNIFLNAGITFVMLILLIPAVFDFITIDLIGLPAKVAHLTYFSTLIFLPWPAAIGYRRFYQGILIRNNLTRRVAYGTGIRLTSMASFALLFFHLRIVEGAYLGAAALSFAVICEAAATRIMVRIVLKRLKTEAPPEGLKPLTFSFISRFYYPLAMTSLLGLGVHPFITFFVGHSRFAIESLAVLPVINSLVFIFRSVGLSFQEAAIALMDDKWTAYKPIRNFSAILAVTSSSILVLIAFTPLSEIWFVNISGLKLELAVLAELPARILCIIPALSVLLSFQRGMLVNGSDTKPVTTATLIEVIFIILVLYILIYYYSFIGATAAAAGMLTGRSGANIYLLRKVNNIKNRILHQ